MDATIEITHMEWLWNFIRKEHLEVVEMIAVLAHGVWLAKNKLCFEQKYINPDLTIANAKLILLSYQRANREMNAR